MAAWEIVRDMWQDGWVGRCVLIAIVFSVALVPLTILATMAEHNRCVEMGGKMISKTTSGIGPSVGGNGQVGVAITTSTVSFCVSSDGRILF